MACDSAASAEALRAHLPRHSQSAGGRVGSWASHLLQYEHGIDFSKLSVRVDLCVLIFLGSRVLCLCSVRVFRLCARVSASCALMYTGRPR